MFKREFAEATGYLTVGFSYFSFISLKNLSLIIPASLIIALISQGLMSFLA